MLPKVSQPARQARALGPGRCGFWHHCFWVDAEVEVPTPLATPGSQRPQHCRCVGLGWDVRGHKPVWRRVRVAAQVDELANNVAEVLTRKGDYSGCPVVRLLHDRHHEGPIVRAAHLGLHDVTARHAVREHRDPDQPRQPRLDLLGVQPPRP